ncbi:serine/threonine-protein kinase MPS1 isoform X2 [Salvia miltiorrhiza]|uniref:serine/threonine-protein kinase MPS1 isoform X2 n=1 Tax=Salvia miltiorrhiza TaxID=226208 RepID=UPI0025AC281B|nr:serine/threonine-protein kinase MPS1 isoform X2 [Salvia miltiorrhiza]
MEGEPDLPAPPAEAKFFNPKQSRPITINPDSINLSRSFNTSSTYNSTSSSSQSPPDFVRDIQAAFKRHRPVAVMHRPRRNVVPQREPPKESSIKPQSRFDSVKCKEDILQSQGLRSSVPKPKPMLYGSAYNHDNVPITPSPPSEGFTTVDPHDVNIKLFNTQRDQPTRPQINDAVASLEPGPGNALGEVQRKVHFSSDAIATSLETETGMGNQVDTSAAVNQDWRNHNFQSMEMENSLRSEGGISSLLTGRTMGVHDQLHQFGSFLQNDLNNAMTQSSLIGSSCVTSTLMNSSSAPMISSTTYCLQSLASGSQLGTGPAEENEGQMDVVQPSCSLSKNAVGESASQSAVTSQAVSSALATAMEVNKSSGPCKEFQTSSPHDYSITKDSPQVDNSIPVKGDAPNEKSQLPPPDVPPSDMKLENSKSEKLERGATGKATSTSRKKGYDPDLFFKVNGKLYQRLGKIGSGGSSEVHKVISSDCTIYALKKIKLKGRDYATAFGFCQEIEYLNKLRGKNNIIQLVDYEVTDKTLLKEVMHGSMSNKEGRVRDDGFIYMVLEYGEIDLAHMLAQKWKELDGSNATIDENWLRFYWQQILQAVNTIHEERIVHSDLKPANFLLVRGSLKLIDFGIAKAIMSDTTNIQRDSQVGTLSYMSPEAFMCNETDANGNTIKCGRPSDIWSLGCILYQMVYGRTPFAEYRTFWAKFKVITDPNHEIIYEPLPNPWLLDLLKKCLAWDRNERWRIPELLQHPFLVPPVPPKSPSPPDQLCALVQLIVESTADDQKGALLCSQLYGMLTNPRDQLRKFLQILNRLL